MKVHGENFVRVKVMSNEASRKDYEGDFSKLDLVKEW